MKIDGPFYAQLPEAGAEAQRLADIGYDGVYTLEGPGDPFLPLAVAGQVCPGLGLATGIAVAFPRNPSHIAYQAWDLQRFSKGNFLLGIGSQVKAHIEKRFGVDFDPPASRMREYIQAVKAFFDCWQNGTPLDFRGRFYQHTLMTPMFNPGPLEVGPPPILLGAMGPGMTRVAGQVADGLIVHPFHSMPFLENEQLPVLAEARESAGRAGEVFTTQIAAMVATGETEEAMAAARESVRGLVAFYASTPAYRPPMIALGYEDLQPELNRMSKAGRWDEMSTLIDDTFLEAIAVCAEPGDVASALKAKYAGSASRLGIYAPYGAPDAMWQRIISELKTP